jgi:predicted  nucleic acid-binding Zn-ribbon protein
MSDAAAAPPFELLLTLQEHDTHLEQLRHRYATLPERKELETVEAAVAGVEAEMANVQNKLDAAGRDQKRREDEVGSLEAKIAEVDGSLYGGTITSPRELQDLQEELDALKRRRSGIEDEILELMEYVDPLQEQMAGLQDRRSVHDGEAQVILGRLAELEAEIDAELAGVEAARASVQGELPTEVVEMYEGLRKGLGGVAVARLEHGTCGGCHLSLPSAELDRIRHLPPDSTAHCEECGRILVR